MICSGKTGSRSVAAVQDSRFRRRSPDGTQCGAGHLWTFEDAAVKMGKDTEVSMLFVKSHIKFHSVLQAFLSACAVSIVGQMSSRSLVPALVLPALILLFYSVYGFFGHSAAAGGSAFSKDHEIVSFDLVSLLFAAFFCTYGRTRYTGNFRSPGGQRSVLFLRACFFLCGYCFCCSFPSG